MTMPELRAQVATLKAKLEANRGKDEMNRRGWESERAAHEQTRAERDDAQQAGGFAYGTHQRARADAAEARVAELTRPLTELEWKPSWPQYEHQRLRANAAESALSTADAAYKNLFAQYTKSEAALATAAQPADYVECKSALASAQSEQRTWFAHAKESLERCAAAESALAAAREAVRGTLNMSALLSALSSTSSPVAAPCAGSFSKLLHAAELATATPAELRERVTALEQAIDAAVEALGNALVCGVHNPAEPSIKRALSALRAARSKP